MNVPSSSESTQSAFTPRTGEAPPGPPKLSVLAVVALLAAPFAAAAVISPLWWPVAGAALVFGVLVKIYLSHHRDTLWGEPLAIFGLAVALVFVVAAPTRFFLRQFYIADQSAQIGREWLQYIVRGQPYNAYESYSRPVSRRRPLTESLEWQYASDPNESQGYFDFLNTTPGKPNEKSLVKALTLLPKLPGHPIEVRHYKTESIEEDKASDDNPYGGEVIRDVFAVTWHDEQEKPNSLLVRLELERRLDPTRVEGLWRVRKYELVEKPK